MDKRDNILKDTPDYEQYTENEAVLTLEEQREFGLLKCGGCCSKKAVDVIVVDAKKDAAKVDSFLLNYRTNIIMCISK
jgi:sulfate adenylyltransferase subunit 1 (EFTu-like GTPase family)